jgi:hypothetical protein
METSQVAIKVEPRFRPAYKGKFMFWKTVSTVLFFCWLLTLGMLFYYYSHREVVWQIPPSSQK